jgi:ribosomal subunit interface protein
MGLRVSGKHFQLGETLRTHIESRIGAAAEKFFDGGMSGVVVLDHEGPGYRTDCTLHLTSGITLHCEGYAHEPFASFDMAADRLERRLRRYHGRLKERHPAASAPLETVPAKTFSLANEDEAEESPGGFSPMVVAETKMTIRTLSVSTAVLDLDYTGAPVVVFRHATSGRVNVVYRRPDGHIGWVDPTGSEDPRPTPSP